MFRTRTHLVIASMAIVLFVLTTMSQDGLLPAGPFGPSTPPGAASAKELWDKAGSLRLFSPPPPPVTAPPPSNAAWCWIVAYLGSKDPELRDAAAEIVATSKRPFGVEAVLQYLPPGNPTNVRMAALKWTILGFRFRKDHWMDLRRVSKEERGRELKAAGEVFNELFKADVAPPFTAEVVAAMRGGEFQIAKSLQPLIARRLLAVYSGYVARSGQSDIRTFADIRMFGVLEGMEPTIVAREAAAWYRIEPSARMRRDMLTYMRSKDMKALKPLYEVAAKDWDTDNANLAKKQPERLRSTHGSAGGGGTPTTRRGKPSLLGPLLPPMGPR